MLSTAVVCSTVSVRAGASVYSDRTHRATCVLCRNPFEPPPEVQPLGERQMRIHPWDRLPACRWCCLTGWKPIPRVREFPPLALGCWDRLKPGLQQTAPATADSMSISGNSPPRPLGFPRLHFSLPRLVPQEIPHAFDVSVVRSATSS